MLICISTLLVGRRGVYHKKIDEKGDLQDHNLGVRVRFLKTIEPSTWQQECHLVFIIY